MPGFDNNTMWAENVDFRNVQPVQPQMVSDGQLLIGATASPHIRAATLTPGPNVTVTNGPGSIIIGLTGVSTTDLHTAKFIVGSLSNGANYATITAALAAASSGDTIFIQTGTYTENLTLKAGVNLTAATGDSSLFDDNAVGTFNVTIIGTLTATFSGTANISNICLQTNSAVVLSVTGANTTLINLNNCYINATNNSAISCTAAAANINLTRCCGDLGTTGINYFTATAGDIFVYYCNFQNAGSSTTASTFSNSNLQMEWSVFNSIISTTNAGNIGIGSSIFGAGNTTALSLTGTNSTSVIGCVFGGGSSSAVSVGAGCSAHITNCEVNSSNTNVFTGAGSLTYGGVVFSGSSSGVNVTSTTGIALTTPQGGTGLNAPGASGNVLTSNGTIWTSATPTNAFSEGTFTPTLIGGSTAGSTTYSAQNGYYTRIGNLVTVNAYVAISAATGTGSVTLGDLPFTIRNQTNGYVNGAIFWQGTASWTWPAGATSISALGTFNTNTAFVWASGTAIGGNFMQMANAALAVSYSLTYQI